MSDNLKDDAVKKQARPFKELQDCGFLWLINTSVFHPRGFALAFHVNDQGEVTGWSLQGDGSERWCFSEDTSKWPLGKSPDDAFRQAEREFGFNRVEGEDND